MTGTSYLYPRHVEQAVGIRSGSPCIAGTGIRVIHVLRLYRERGLSAIEIAGQLQLPVAAVHGGLAFALENESVLLQEEQRRDTWVEEFRTQGGRASA